jgi:membrane dipeptidase
MGDHIPFFDGHNDFLLRLMMSPDPRAQTWLGTERKGHLDLARMKEAGFAGGLFAIFIPPISSGPPPDFKALMASPPYHIAMPPLMTHDVAQPTALTMAGLLHWMERAAPNDFKVCRTAGEIRTAMAQDVIAGVMHMEGAEAIGPDLDALYLFYDIGLRSLGPVWSRETIFGHGVPMAFPRTPDIGPGLTEKGKDLVRLCNELGIVIDLSHMNEAGFNDVAALSTAPLVATHSNAFAHSASPRNLTDRQLHQIRDTGGMVGLNYATFYLHETGIASPEMGWDTMFRHIDHLIAELGEDHVGLGSDFDGCVVPKLIGDVTGVRALLDALAGHGYGTDLVTKFAHANWLSCLERSLH